VARTFLLPTQQQDLTSAVIFATSQGTKRTIVANTRLFVIHQHINHGLHIPARTHLIYDHLEDPVYAPRSCATSSCTNASCDDYNCFTSFPQDEFQSAEAYFNDHLLHAVENAKLDRPIDSTPSLAHNTYVAQEADWGDQWGDYPAYQEGEWDDQWYEEDDKQEYVMEHEEEYDVDHDEEVFTTHVREM
jgi:hypothetical protein